MARAAREEFLLLTDAQRGMAEELGRLLYGRRRKLDEARWNAVARRWLNIRIMTPVLRAAESLERLRWRFAREAYLDTRKQLLEAVGGLMSRVPTAVLPEKEAAPLASRLVNARNLRFDWRTGAAAIRRESVAVTEQLGRESVKLAVGTGRVTREFEVAIRDLLTGPDAPSIKTLSTQHVAELQRVLLDDIRAGADLAWTRDRFVARVTADWTSSEARRQFENNTMRILRTTHQRAAATSISMWGLANPRIVEELERVADGRPCFLKGHKILMADGTEKPIEDVRPMELVFDGYGKKGFIAQTHRTWYSGTVVSFEIEDGRTLTCTESHEIFVMRNGKELKIAAKNLRPGDTVVAWEF